MAVTDQPTDWPTGRSQQPYLTVELSQMTMAGQPYDWLTNLPTHLLSNHSPIGKVVTRQPYLTVKCLSQQGQQAGGGG